MGFRKFSLKWVPNVLSADQKAARVSMSRELYRNLLLERQHNVSSVIAGDGIWYYWSYSESFMWALSRNDVPTKPLQKSHSKKAMFTIFFTGEKLVFLDSVPKGQNIDPYYLCNTVLEGVKAGALAGTRKSTLRDFQIHMHSCKAHNSRFTIGQ
jgi:hypothetical protein